MTRAQVLVEFALILPLQLFIILGGLQLGLALTTEIRLTHAAQAAATNGAAASDRRCERAIEAVVQIYGSRPDEVECTEPDALVEIRVADTPVAVNPFGAWKVSAIGRAIGETPSPSP